MLILDKDTSMIGRMSIQNAGISIRVYIVLIMVLIEILTVILMYNIIK